MNIFSTILTYPAPSANYRGEKEENRLVIQKVTHGRFEYPIISPEAMRNALRETLHNYGVPCNRERLHNENQPAVKYDNYPDPQNYADDFLFGYFVANRSDIPDQVLKKPGGFQFKRDSVFRMNLAKALEPYRHDTVFTQSPLMVKSPEAPWQNASSSVLLLRETSVTAFQFPWAINLDQFSSNDNNLEAKYKQWLMYLLKAISELNSAAGNHARSYFEMAPASIVIRLTDSLVAGYDTYGFQPDSSFPELTQGILAGDYPGNEFYFGGQIVKSVLEQATQEQLKTKGVTLFRMANAAMDAISKKVAGQGFLELKSSGD